MVATSPELRAGLFARIDEIAAQLEADVATGDDLRRLPDTSVAALRDAGLLRLKVPTVLGGDEADPDLQFEVFERVARHNACAAWCLFIYADSVGAACARLGDEGLATLLADGEPPVMCGGGGLRPGRLTPVDGGYTLDGSFRYGSGIHAARWVLLNGVVATGDGRREVRVCVVPTAELDVADTWHVLGMRGTGSTDFAARGAFVPEAMTYAPQIPPRRGGRMYRTGIVGYLGYPLPAVAHGIVRRALDEIVNGAATTTRGYAKPVALAERATFHAFLGEADQRLRAARALMLDDGRELMAAAEQADVDLRPLEARTRAAGAWAVRTASDVLADAVRFAGGGALRDGSVVERAVRDLAVAASHLLVDESSYENHARFLLGLPDADPMA
jgi:alkylation response protein AidB-like acyl-CoA dehydrogenase